MWSNPLATIDGPALFGLEHRIVLAIIAVSIIALSIPLRWALGRPCELVVRRAVCWPLAGLLLAGAVVGQIHRVVTGVWSLDESLPFHLCDIGVLVTALALWGAGLKTRGEAPPEGESASRRRFWQQMYELAYFWGVGGTVQAVVTPDVEGVFPATTCVRYFVLHGGIVVAVFSLTIGLRMRPLPGAVRRVWLVTFALALVVMLINWLIDANYMYLCGPPANPTLYDAFGPWPWSLVPLVLVGTLIFVLCYAPFWFMDRAGRRRRRSDLHAD